MKHSLVLLLLFLVSSFVRAQDMMITQFGDTLNKKIIYSTKRYLFYADSNFYGRHFVKGIKKNRLAGSRMNAYRVDRNTAMMNQRAQEVMGNSFMLQGGIQLGFIPIPVDSESTKSWRQFISDLRFGFSYNGEFLLRMRPHSFIGVFIDDFRSSAFAEKLDVPDANGTLQHLQNIKSSISMLQAGPEFLLFRDSKKFRHFFIISGGVAFTQFSWKISAANRTSETYRASGIGIRGSIAKTWALGRTLIVGPNFKFQTAILADESGLAGSVARVNLGLTVLAH